MVIYGGMNDFSKVMSDLAVYDLETNQWEDPLRVLGNKPPSLSHTAACSVFYQQRSR